ncbi:MAG: phosphotransferase enzyme family protein [Lachnospiraceae bacterium]
MLNTDLCSNIREAMTAFQLDGTITGHSRYGNGHINDTFLLCTQPENSDNEKRYILQRINHHIFKNPGELIENISGVTSYLNQKIKEQQGDPLRETLNLVKTKENQDLFQDGIGCYWRCYLFIEDTVCYEKAENSKDFYESGKAFGNFQNLLAKYPAATLHETIPDFHHTPRRYQTLIQAANRDLCQRASLVLPELTFIKKRASEVSSAFDLQQKGLLPLRVTHNDTKLNNILFDQTTKKAICVIDLDTIMPGLSIHDFGDAIRFGANTALEDETDLDRVSLSLELFDSYTRGFLEGCSGRLTNQEIRMLPMGAKLMTLECGIRFLTDYLQGDTYFKIHRPDHNLDRARTQLKLVADMEKKWDLMGEIVSKYDKQSVK